LLAAALLGEMMHSVQTLGIVLVLAAIVIAQLPSRTVAEASVAVEPIE
jgi:drug/metabolite transporter (DMT)-like permease